MNLQTEFPQGVSMTDSDDMYGSVALPITRNVDIALVYQIPWQLLPKTDI